MILVVGVKWVPVIRIVFMFPCLILYSSSDVDAGELMLSLMFIFHLLLLRALLSLVYIFSKLTLMAPL